MNPRIRPWDVEQCEAHFRDLKLQDRFDRRPKRILDVGFGNERRSALALRKLFPDSEIVAIDNDLALFDKTEKPDSKGNRINYRFSDVDLLEIPGEEGKYDLVVFCMSLFCLQNPLRAIGTVASRFLNKDGLLLITQRNDRVMRALCELPPEDGEDTAGSAAARIRAHWEEIRDVMKRDESDLVLPWRFRLVCEHVPLMSFIGDFGFRDITRKLEPSKLTGLKSSNAYPTSAAVVETLGQVLGGSIPSRQEPQYSAMQWAWRQFKAQNKDWPMVYMPEEPLPREITLSSRIFKLTGASEVSEHPFRTYTAPLKVLPEDWQCTTGEELELRGRGKVGAWISKRKLDDSVRGFYLLSPHGVAGAENASAPLSFYEHRDVKPLDGALSGGLQLSQFLVDHSSNSVMIQFYRVSSDYWREGTVGSEFLTKAADPVMMLAFPIFLSDDKEKDIAGMVERLLVLENQLFPQSSDSGKAKPVNPEERRGVAEYLRSRGKWMRDNGAYGIYYYFRKTPSADSRPVSRGASMLVAGALPIETTLEFLVMAEEVIVNYQAQRNVHLLDQRREFGERAARAGILVRNLSHHVGSHVLVHRQAAAQEVFTSADGEAEKIGTIVNSMLTRVSAKANEDGDFTACIRNLKRAFGNLKSDSDFYTYIRERMEFLAMLSLDAQRWATPVALKDLLAFLGDGRKSAILRKSIGGDKRISIDELSLAAVGDDGNEIVALPWGTTGFHAFYAFVEGVLRNACKHGAIAPGSSVELRVKIKRVKESGDLWLYCGVSGQTVKARDAAMAILGKIRGRAQPDKSVSGEGASLNPIEKLNDFFELDKTGPAGRHTLWITQPEGGYAHGALGMMELCIVSEFLSGGKAGLRVRDEGGELFLGFMLTKPKELYCPGIPLNASDALPAEFSFEWESFIVSGAPVLSAGLPPQPLGPRTLYLSETLGDPRFAVVDPTRWEDSPKNHEAVAALILGERLRGGKFRVVIDGPAERGRWGKYNDEVVFVDQSSREDYYARLRASDDSKILILAHQLEEVRQLIEAGGPVPDNIRIFPLGGGNPFIYPYVIQCLRAGKPNALRLTLYEAAFLKYEIYDDRILAEFTQGGLRVGLDAGASIDGRQEKFSGILVNVGDHITLKPEKNIEELINCDYSPDIVRLIHVTPWDMMVKGGAKLDWKRFYPNIVFFTGRGGDVQTSSQAWDSPRVDYSSVERALGGAGGLRNPDVLMSLALLTRRRGCLPRRPT